MSKIEQDELLPRQIVTLTIATIFVAIGLVKPLYGKTPDNAIQLADELIDNIERKHGKLTK